MEKKSKTLKHLFKSTSDKKVQTEIAVENTRILKKLSFAIFIIEMLSLLAYIPGNWQRPKFMLTVFNVSYCIITCLAIYLVSSKIMKRYEQTEMISILKSKIALILFYLVLSIWGTTVDIEHYLAGEQMLTFYIVQFSFLCFIVVRPKIGATMIASTFLIMLICAYMVDGAVSMQPLNHLIFGAITILGNAMRYNLLERDIKNRMELTELNEILQKEVVFDDLTKLKNRYALRLDTEKYIGKNLIVAMTDVDYFKKFNDTYGHLVGDEVLRQVSARMKECINEEGVYRYGGDEFAYVVTGCSEEEYLQRIAKLKTLVSELKIPTVKETITCSSGYAVGKPMNEQEYENLFKEADDKLYEVKRNRKSKEVQHEEKRLVLCQDLVQIKMRHFS